MIILRDKSFGVSQNRTKTHKAESIEQIGESTMKEIIKIIEMNGSTIGDQNQYHWLSEKIINQYIARSVNTLGINSILAINEDPDWELIIKRLIGEVRKGDHKSGSNEPKYEIFYKNNPEPTSYTVDDWHLIFRFIALCLLGELDPEVDEFWKIKHKLQRTKVNTKRKVLIDLKAATKTLATAIDNVLLWNGSKVIKEFIE